MSVPFGGHPRFGDYLRWAHEQGCKVEWGVDPGTTLPIVKITRRDKARAVIEVAVAQDEFLLPTQIGYYDRALGLKSPWFVLDPTGSEDEQRET